MSRYHDPHRRPLGSGMRALLYVLTGLTFFAGTQLFVLAEHTTEFFSWTIDPPLSAAFVGAGFWSAAVISFWAARQCDWARARIPIPTIAVVATLLLVATLDHLDTFHGLLGLAWIEVYAIFLPALVALVARQLVIPGVDRRSGERLPAGLRSAWLCQAAALIAAGVVIYADGGSASIWPWELTPLAAKAVGTWLIGIGLTAAVVAAIDDRADMAGNSVSQLVLGVATLIALVRFGGDAELGAGTGVAFVAFAVAILGSGIYGTLVAFREGRFAPALEPGGIPVELRPLAPSAPAAERDLLRRALRRSHQTPVDERLGH
jgi:hypothetical protein